MRNRVLVADNDHLLRAAVQEGLESAGYQVSGAADGLEAWQKIQDESPDYLVLHPVMPKLDGVRLCGCLKADPRFRSLPIFVLIDSAPESAHELEGLEAEACIAKRSAGETVASLLHAFCAFEQGERPSALGTRAQSPGEPLARKNALELLAETAHLTAALQNLEEGVLLLDRAGRGLYTNPAGVEILQRSERELLGVEAATFLDGSAGDSLRQALHTLASQGTGASLRLDASCGDRTLRLVVTNLFRQGQVVGYLLLIRDSRPSETIRQHAAGLEARVQERTRELEAANEQLRELSRHKSEHLSTLSHELREPLHYIIGFSDLLLMEGYDPLTDRQARFLGHIQKSSRHLLQLISDILDLSKIEAGMIDLSPEPLPVAQAVEEVLTIHRELANKKAQEFRADIPPNLPSLTADPVRFKQILVNLLSNAMRFTPEQGRIVLTARQVPTCAEGPETVGGAERAKDSEPGLWLEIRVADTGTGIKAADLPRLFQPFVQLRTVTAGRHEGSGLGLAITKRLVELHGGRIWAQSDGEGCGSTFTVLLPLGGPGAPV
jgi:signal transduction histidine kinase/AmiR/NasT family two-component response regulator